MRRLRLFTNNNGFGARLSGLCNVDCNTDMSAPMSPNLSNIESILEPFDALRLDRLNCGLNLRPFVPSRIV